MGSVFAKIIRRRLPALLAVLFLCLAALPGVSSAQTSAGGESASQAQPSPNDIRELMRLLADPAMRNWLAQNASDQPQSEPEYSAPYDFRAELALATSSVHQRLGDLSTLWTDIPSAFGFLSEVIPAIQTSYEVLEKSIDTIASWKKSSSSS